MRYKPDMWQVSLLAVIMLMLALVPGLMAGVQAAYAWTPGPGQNVVVDNGHAFCGKDTSGNERPMLAIRNSNGIQLNAPPAGAIFFTVANTEMMRIANSGSVGIGDATPVEGKLVVKNTSGYGIYSESSNVAVTGLSSAGDGVSGSTSSSGFAGVAGENTAGGNGVYGYSASGNAIKGESPSGYAGYFDGDVRVTGDMEVGPAPAVKMGRIYMEASGTIISTDGGTRVLLWDKEHYAIKMTNTSGDWIDYWWQTQKFDETDGFSNMLDPGISEVTIISGIDGNSYGIEVHFGQADGTDGWCSVWLQYVYGKLVGHYIKY